MIEDILRFVLDDGVEVGEDAVALALEVFEKHSQASPVVVPYVRTVVSFLSFRENRGCVHSIDNSGMLLFCAAFLFLFFGVEYIYIFIFASCHFPVRTRNVLWLTTELRWVSRQFFFVASYRTAKCVRLRNNSCSLVRTRQGQLLPERIGDDELKDLPDNICKGIVSPRARNLTASILALSPFG